MRKFIIPGVALAGLASLTLLSTAGPADAKPVECRPKYQACNSRCIGKNLDNPLPCIERTCNVQYDQCVRNGGDPGDKVKCKGRACARGLVGTPAAKTKSPPPGIVARAPFSPVTAKPTFPSRGRR